MLNENPFKFFITFIIIFAIILGFMFLWAKALDRFFLFKKQIKPESLAWTVSVVGVAISTTLSIAILYLIINFILNFSDSIGEKIASQSQLSPLDKSDCKTLVDFVYKSQSEISVLENHRGIEENANLFTLNLEYQKGLDILQKKATEYNSFPVKKNTKIYTETIAKLLNEKAGYFQQRINVDLNQTDVKGVLNLLDKMDSVTEERTKIVNQIDRQCK
jgi:ABC-type lipoprotein release transport system permease subunit